MNKGLMLGILGGGLWLIWRQPAQTADVALPGISDAVYSVGDSVTQGVTLVNNQAVAISDPVKVVEPVAAGAKTAIYTGPVGDWDGMKGSPSRPYPPRSYKNKEMDICTWGSRIGQLPSWRPESEKMTEYYKNSETAGGSWSCS